MIQTNTLAQKSTILLPILLFLLPFWGKGQTVLQPGDLLVIAVSTNFEPCAPAGTLAPGEDVITFVVFQDITPGTTIDFTDNGWERANAGFWGNTEGFVRMTRDAGSAIIPAGTPIQIKLPTQIGDPYVALGPDGDWTFQQLTVNPNPPPANLGGTGDQLYFLSGGTWVEGTIGNHDGEYVGGNVLYGFNMLDTWAADGTPNQSNLHPDVDPCLHIQPPVGSPQWDHAGYDGLLTATTQIDWIQRVGEPANWQRYPNCNFFPPNFTPSLIIPTSIGMFCTTCSGCPPFQAELFFGLPVAGTFDVVYTNGVDTFTQGGISNGANQLFNLNATTTYTLLSVSQNGCPVGSDLGAPVTYQVGPPTPAVPELTVDTCILLPANYDLTGLEDTLTGGDVTIAVAWYEDAALTTQILIPTAFPITGLDTVYASLGDPACPAAPVPVNLNTNAQPVLNPIAPQFCVIPGNPTTVDLDSLTQFVSPGLQGQLIWYEIGNVGGTPLPNPFTYVGATYEAEVIAISTGGCTAGPITITFTTLDAPDPNNFSVQIDPNQGCPPVDANIQFNTPDANLYAWTLSINDSTFTQALSGSVSFPFSFTDSADVVPISVQDLSNSCVAVFPPDTINVVVFPDAALVRDQNLVACDGNPVDLNDGVMLASGSDPLAQLSFHSALPPTTGNQLASPIVNITNDTIFYAFTRTPNGCSDTIDIPVLLDLNAVQLTVDPLNVYNGFTISCSGGNNGSISLGIQGGTAPYTINWSNGATSQVITDLTEGVYSVTVTDFNGCSQVDSATAIAPPALGATYSIPAQDCGNTDVVDVQLDSVSGGIAPFEWSINGVTFNPLPGAFPVILQAIPVGSQTISIRDANGCIRQDSFDLVAPGSNDTLSVPSEFSIITGEQVLIEPQANFTPVQVLWTPQEGISDPTSLVVTASPANSTQYTLQVESPNGCFFQRDVFVEVVQPRDVFVPSAFSPNSDGANDSFFPFSSANNQLPMFQIFDRWGSLIYEAENLNPLGDGTQGWDGNYKGKPMPPGVYIYVLEVVYPDNFSEIRRGEFSLLR